MLGNTLWDPITEVKKTQDYFFRWDKKMKVLKGLRRLVKKIISSCIKCRLIATKTVELKMAKLPCS